MIVATTGIVNEREAGAIIGKTAAIGIGHVIVDEGAMPILTCLYMDSLIRRVGT